MKRKLMLYVSIFSVLFILTGCTKSVKYDDVKNYSDDIVNSLLVSINNIDYNTFSSYLSEDMKESYSLSTFQSESANIINNAGVFESATFYAGKYNKEYISLIYDVQFSSMESTTPISITFKKNDDDHKIYQIYLDSDLSAS